MLGHTEVNTHPHPHPRMSTTLTADMTSEPPQQQSVAMTTSFTSTNHTIAYDEALALAGLSTLAANGHVMQGGGGGVNLGGASSSTSHFILFTTPSHPPTVQSSSSQLHLLS